MPEYSKVKISYYETRGNKKKYLVFVANPTDTDDQEINIEFADSSVEIYSICKQKYISSTLVLNARGSDVYIIE